MLINEHKRAYDSVVSLLALLDKTVPKQNTKKAKKLFIQCQHLKKKKNYTREKKWHSPFCFSKDKLDVVLCVKASKFMHTREHTHSFLSTEKSSVLSGTVERRSAEM